MVNLLKNYSIYVLAVCMLCPATWAQAFERKTVCEKSANKMYRSCLHETKEELAATSAKCINQVGDDEPTKWQCHEEAFSTYKEDRALCGEQKEARKDVCDLLDEDRYGSEGLLDTANFVEDPDNSNPYFSLEPGHTHVSRAGEDFEETIVVTVTDEVREVLGVNCRLVVDVVFEEDDGELQAVEVTDDYYAQALNGDIHYCGEVSRNYEDGRLADLDGSFEAGLELAKSGILIKSAPATHDAHRQEYLLGEAEDVVRYVAGADNPSDVGAGEGGDNPNFPCEANCIKTEEFVPPEPDSGEYKYYIAGTGFVLGVALEDGEVSGEREELLCTGDSLDVLNDPDCGIEDVDALREQLCEFSPVAFCD